MHAQQAGEICMIRKIECMVATFNGEEALKAKYCAACTDDTKAKTVQVQSNVSGNACSIERSIECCAEMARQHWPA